MRAEEKLDAVGEYFSKENSIEYITDIGTWKLTLTDFVGKKYKADGTLWADLMTSRGGLSDMIHQCLGNMICLCPVKKRVILSQYLWQ